MCRQLHVIAAHAFSFLALHAAGCAAGGSIHPEYRQLKPRDIAVLSVKNETIADLGRVTFGGPLQRTIVGVESYNVLELLRGAIEEALLKAGYFIAEVTEPLPFDPGKPLLDGADRPAFQAAVLASVESWQAHETSNFASFALRYRLEMRRVPTAELLYSGTFTCEQREGRAQTSESLPRAIRRSVARALGALSAANE